MHLIHALDALTGLEDFDRGFNADLIQLRPLEATYVTIRTLLLTASALILVAACNPSATEAPAEAPAPAIMGALAVVALISGGRSSGRLSAA